MTIDFGGGNFSEAITFNGGGQNTSPLGDTLVLTGGGTFADATFTYSNENDGTIDITGTSTITYTGLEPITSNINAIDVTLNYSASAETITVSDAFGGQTTVDSDLAGETTTFNNPSGTLTINGGNTGVNTIDVGALASSYPASINIVGGDGGDTVNFNGLLRLADDKSLTVNALTINTPNIGSDIFTTGSGSVTLSATRNILMSSASSISTVDGGITLTANAGGTSTGNFSGIRLSNADLVTSGNGAISLDGKGGNTNVDQWHLPHGRFGDPLYQDNCRRRDDHADRPGISCIVLGHFHHRQQLPRITSNVGDIQLTGNAVDGVGVILTNSPTVRSLGSGANAALISIDGTAV